MRSNRILIIEDEAAIRRFLKVSLEAASFAALEAQSGTEGLAMAASYKPDLIILDIGLPDINGFDVLRKLREWYERPIVVLTVHDQEDEKVRALDGGADDYLTKPFSVPELMARIRASLRRVTDVGAVSPVFKAGSFEMDKSAHVVRVSGREVHLTATEYDLLAVLVKHAGKVVTHRMLLNEVWGPNSVEHVQYVRVYMGQIRRKLRVSEDSPELIATEPGVGYRFLFG